MTRYLLAACLVTALPFAIANAEDRHPHGPPPQAALDACASSRSGDACTFALGDHAITGTCAALPSSSTLACRPDHPPGPPPEAVQACASAAEGAACTMTHDNYSISGTCAKGPDGNGPLACRPSGPPPAR